MKNLSVISAGYIGGELSDHNNYEQRINKHEPIEAKDFSVVSNYYGDLGFNFNFNGKTIGLDAALGANVTDDIIAWLEAICLGYRESIFVIDAEGPLQMFRFYSLFDETPRFTVLSSQKYFFEKKREHGTQEEVDEGEDIWFSFDDKIHETYEKTDDTQIICDILISKKEFVLKVWQAVQAGLEKTPDNFYTEENADLPIRKSDIIEDFLKQ